MDLMIEILIWIAITVVVFYVCNMFFSLRTAASLFLSFLVSSILIFSIYGSIFGEIVLMFTIFIGIIYALFRSLRDKRDDIK